MLTRVRTISYRPMHSDYIAVTSSHTIKVTLSRADRLFTAVIRYQWFFVQLLRQLRKLLQGVLQLGKFTCKEPNKPNVAVGYITVCIRHGCTVVQADCYNGHDCLIAISFGQPSIKTRLSSCLCVSVGPHEMTIESPWWNTGDWRGSTYPAMSL